VDTVTAGRHDLRHGTWVYENPNGQSACYETLEINTSCPRMASSDFPMPADYPDCALHHQVADYFDAYVDHFGFRHAITFDTRFDQVMQTDDGRWRVTTTTGSNGSDVRDYHNVIVANGHHWDPRLPDPAYPGTFDGEQIHSHAYSSAAQLADRDIAVEASTVARSAVISQRRGSG